jgi:hypothetical protein
LYSGQGGGDELREFLDLEHVLLIQAQTCIREHVHAVRASGCEDFGSGLNGILDAKFTESFAHGDFRPDATSSPGTAYALLSMGPELPDLRSGEGIQELAWRIVEFAVSPQVTGIVKSDLLPDGPRKL